MTSDPKRANCILCVPTALELERLRSVAPAAVDPSAWKAVEVLGFGPVAAAARGAALGAEYPGSDFLLAGIAGGYPGPHRGHSSDLRIGEAAFFGSVGLDGVGAGEGATLALPSAMGFPQLQDPLGAVHETLPLGLPGGAPPRTLLTVCASSSSSAMVAHRRGRFPGAEAEDMEAFGLALAARILGRELWVVRGISNEAGDRDTSTWRIDDALSAAGQILRALP